MAGFPHRQLLGHGRGTGGCWLGEARRSRRLLSLRDTARAMSQENVERIRRAFAGTTAGDFSYLPGLIHETCEFRLPPDFPGTQDARGAEGFLSVVREFEDAFEQTR